MNHPENLAMRAEELLKQAFSEALDESTHIVPVVAQDRGGTTITYHQKSLNNKKHIYTFSVTITDSNRNIAIMAEDKLIKAFQKRGWNYLVLEEGMMEPNLHARAIDVDIKV